jgi:uncharacterized protein YndB with AHSA1/START domain
VQLTTPNDREIVITRVFDAPRDLVFEAFTDPELIKRWLLGPDGWSMPVCEVDLRVGGMLRYLWRNDAEGHEFGMTGVYREIVRPERIVHVEKYDEAWYPGEALVTETFVEREGATTFTMTVTYESRAARDTALESGMERGIAASYDRLAEVLEPQPAP